MEWSRLAFFYSSLVFRGQRKSGNQTTAVSISRANSYKCQRGRKGMPPSPSPTPLLCKWSNSLTNCFPVKPLNSRLLECISLISSQGKQRWTKTTETVALHHQHSLQTGASVTAHHLVQFYSTFCQVSNKP